MLFINNNKLSSFLVLFNLLVFSSATCAEDFSTRKIDSLRMKLSNTAGVEKISIQLDLALKIINNNKNEALSLSESALKAAKTLGNRTLKMHSFFTLGRIYSELDNLELSLANLDSALIIAEEINDNWNKGEILFRAGVVKHRKGDYFLALETFNASIRASRLSGNYKTLGSSYSLMGTIFRMNGLYDRAIEFIIKSKLNYEKANFDEGSAWAAYLLGRIYADLKLPQKAFKYFNAALEEYQRLASIDGVKNGVAICYEQIGILNIELGNFDEARKNIDYTLEIYTANKSKYGISNGSINLGKIEYFTGNYLKAENYLYQALKVKTEIDDMLSIPRIYQYLGLSLIERGKTKDGFNKIQQGLDIAISNNQKRIQLDIYATLAEKYLSLKDLENVITSQKKLIQIQNLILSGDANIKTEQLQAIYEIDEKNKQIAELEKENKINTLSIKQHTIIRNIMILGIVIAIVILLIGYWFYTQIKHKNREFNDTNATKDKFFAIIAHDLRGPTSALASLLEHLSTSFDDFSIKQLKQMLLSLHKSAENVSNLLENLLIWAQSQIAKIEYRPVELKLCEVLQNSLLALTQSAEKKQINIKYEINDEVFVFADPDMVQTIVRNILSNAIKFSKRGGLVTINTELKDKNTATIKISDNGVGIEKSILTKIFELSNTHHTTGTENEKSTGLGLILVKDFVEKNKGIITIDSEKDRGTIVSFTLPTSQPTATSVSTKLH
jgi:signal transduction histidine kinase